jgi:hypothetical protein
MEGLPDILIPCWTSIFVPISPVSVTTIKGKELIRRINQAKSENIDRWLNANPIIYQDHARRYEISAPANNNPTNQQTLASTTAPAAYESLKERSAKANIARARAITRLLLAREGTNAEGASIIIPGDLCQIFEDVLHETPSRAARILLQQYNALIGANTDDMNMVNNFKAKFPTVIVTISFAATLQNAHWATLPLQQEANMVGQTFTLFSFAPVCIGTAEHKRQLDKSNAVLGEELVGNALRRACSCTVGGMSTPTINSCAPLPTRSWFWMEPTRPVSSQRRALLAH